MNAIVKCVPAAATVALATQAVAQVTFYEGEGFQGRTYTYHLYMMISIYYHLF